jgi:hypothetical protein
MIWTTLAPKLTPFGTSGCNANHINARGEPPPEAEASHERTLEAVGSTALFGPAPVPGGPEKRFLTPFLPRTPAYRITSSARTRSDGGSVIPSA